MAGPVVGHHDACEARMAGEVDAEEIEDLALIEVCGGPDAGDGGDAEVGGVEAYSDAQALLERVREDCVGELDARFLRIPVHGGEVFKEVVAGGLSRLAGLDDGVFRDDDGEFLAVPLGVSGEIAKSEGRGILRERGEYGIFAEDRGVEIDRLFRALRGRRGRWSWRGSH